VKKRPFVLFGLATALCAALLLLVYSMLPGSTPGHVYTAHADGCCGIETSNEDLPPGDWDAMYLYNQPPPAGQNVVSRTSTYVQDGTYSYEHRCDASTGGSWAWTYITCTKQSEYGHADLYIRFEDDFGSGLTYAVMALGDNDTSGLGGFDWSSAWGVYYADYEKRLRLNCANCSPYQDWPLDVMIPEQWYNIRVEWGLPPGASNGYMRAWMDGNQFVDQSGLGVVAAGADVDPVAFGAGVGSWHYLHCDEKAVWIDNIDVSFCAPDPTPTPAPSVAEGCDQYGHAAVLNVDDDCSSVLRFRAIPNEVPHDSVVTRATLFLYGVSVEQVGATINIAPLVPVWGEMTCDWCRRTVGEDWADPGATNVPLDRFPGKVAEFTAELGWVEVDIPTYIIEEWALTSAANPGLVLSNDELTGKYGIASREWVDADYRPYMVVYYTE